MVVAHSHTLQGSGELLRVISAAVEGPPAQQKEPALCQHAAWPLRPLTLPPSALPQNC